MPTSRKRLAWGTAGLLGAVLLATTLRWRKDPSPYLYGQRFALGLPRLFLAHSSLRSVLAPEPGERVLEVESGTGHYALRAARWLEPDGTLDILNLQQQMLDRPMRRARGLGTSKIVPTRGDARSLPYPDGNVDAAFLVTTLGEVLEQKDAVAKLRRIPGTSGAEAAYDPIPGRG